MPESTKEQFKYTGKKILVGLCIAIVALAIAGGIGFGLMYLFEVGPFYTKAADII